LEECGPCPVFARYTLVFALQLRKKHGKTSVRVAEECQLTKIQNNVKEICMKNGYFCTPLTPVRNEYQEYCLGGKGGRCVGLTTLPPSGADCLEIWEPQPPGTLRACPGL